MKKVIHTAKAPAPVGPYSQAIEVNNTLYCSGQIAIVPETNEVNTGSVESQTQQVMKNIQAVLEGGGYTWDHVIKTTIFLTNMQDFATVNAIYGTYFKELPPARSTVQVSALPKGVNVEIEVIASRL
ncbi:MAG: RidA family protein [Bdellovibrionales bacterium]|nr:RidA family protein [Bdellovibrionales bacterium]